jgi:hypothetical protein
MLAKLSPWATCITNGITSYKTPRDVFEVGVFLIGTCPLKTSIGADCMKMSKNQENEFANSIILPASKPGGTDQILQQAWRTDPLADRSGLATASLERTIDLCLAQLFHCRCPHLSQFVFAELVQATTYVPQ